MEFGHVLVPVDFKDESGRDLRAAADIAQSLGVPLLLAHVVAPAEGLERLRPQLDTHNRAQLERARQEVQRLISEIGRSLNIETVVAFGSPAEEIARIAVARSVGLIVMGLRRQEHMFGARPGSIAYRVLGLAPALILGLPPGALDAVWLRRYPAGPHDIEAA
jgi:nucleotide-binding universal stress UspA family protein